MGRMAKVLTVLFALGMAGVLVAEEIEVTLHQVTVPERRKVTMEFVPTSQAPRAEVRAKMTFREGQAEIELKYEDMKPAILYGGDVTSYVLWVVNQVGDAENLGEVWVQQSDETIEFTTGLKRFALMITAESYPLVDRPSGLVMYMPQPVNTKRDSSESFRFSDFEEAPKSGLTSLRAVAWDTSQPVMLMQAEKVFELAKAHGAQEYAPRMIRDAEVTLGQARALSTKSSGKKTYIDYSRRVIAYSSEAMQYTMRRKEAEELDRQIAARKAEMEALEGRAASAEATATEAQAQMAEAEAQRASAMAERESALAQQATAAAAVTAAQLELQRIKAEEQKLNDSLAAMEIEAEKLRKERAELSSRLEGALAQVADTQNSARGLIVSLPDILFDTNESTLKQEARVVIAKLSGILLMMNELNLRVEGHTDSTGSAEHNQRLSERRALSVRDFLASQGVGIQRMVSVGYGMTRPVADNATREGRSKNRRVEIVIGTGEVAAAPDPA